MHTTPDGYATLGDTTGQPWAILLERSPFARTDALTLDEIAYLGQILAFHDHLSLLFFARRGDTCVEANKRTRFVQRHYREARKAMEESLDADGFYYYRGLPAIAESARSTGSSYFSLFTVLASQHYEANVQLEMELCNVAIHDN